jgi:DNA-binding NarL/FixJ family response regulator
MEKIRVLLGFSRIEKILPLKALLMQEPDIEIVGEAIDAVDILLKIASTRAEVVAINLPSAGKDAGLSSHILAEYPEVKIFAVSEEGDRIVMYETGMMRREASDTSLESLGGLIRQSMSNVDNGWVRLPGRYFGDL